LIIGKKLVHLQETDSTNDEARRLIKKGEGEGLVVLADRQTRGRGKPGSAWFSPAGNLYLSVVIKPYRNYKQLSAVTLFSALAVRSAIVKLTQLPAVIKWPNDLRLHGKKTAGILAERLASGHIIIGLGLNVNSTRSSFPPELRPTATSLRRETGKKYSLKSCAALLISLLDEEYRAFLKED
jgi:BirA family transcriptional regulator, biotin operon repressor / biotin---[acetyl-CoA-carboxylase] ligase